MTSRVAFLGTPALAVPTLHALLDAGFDVPIVVSAPDKRRGRGNQLMPSPVKAAALEQGLAVTDNPDDVIESGAEVGVVVAYGRILKPHLLDAMPFVNLHVSLLPRWRGAAPVERAILSGDAQTGVCVMEITEGLDEGGIYATAVTDVGDKTLEELRNELVSAGNDLLVACLRNGLGTPVPQMGEPTYAAKLTAEDRHIDWDADPEQVLRVIRLGDAWTTFRGKRFKIHGAERSADGSVTPTIVQAEGKGRMDFAAWRNGAQLASGEWFE